MASSQSDDELIVIRCPSCSERFKVEEEYIGAMVECGGCEHQFKINNDVILKGKKFYPGEHKDPSLQQFQKAGPKKLANDPAISIAPQLAEAPPASSVEPTSPIRVMLGLFGGLTIAIMALILMLGATRGGMLDGVTTDKRLIMAVFVSILGFCLLVYANPKARLRATLVGLVAAAGLISIPFFFNEASVPLGTAAKIDKSNADSSGNTDTDINDAESDPEKISTSELRELIGTGPLDAEIQRLALKGSQQHAIGIWFKDLRSSNRYLVRDYIVRVTEADLRSHYYPRGHDSYLMVVTGIDESLEEMKELMEPLGQVVNIYPELQIIETVVNNSSFEAAGSIEDLTNSNQAKFYELNKAELNSIDLERVSSAVKRLIEVEPKIFRSDITMRLLELMKADWVDFKDDVARALSVWSEEAGPASEAALIAAKQMRLDDKPIPQEIIALIVKEGNIDVIPLMNQLWKEDPSKWEMLYGQVGIAAEDLMIQNLMESDGIYRDSAIKILGRLGGENSLKAIGSLDLSELGGETRILIRNAKESIRERISAGS